MTNKSKELSQLQFIRNELLQKSDWVVTKAKESNATVPSDWVTYRQELRDITKKFKSMEDKDFVFPTEPTDAD